MSKLYDQYIERKKENANIIYLFKNGLFYISLEDDALKLSELFKLKLTNFGNLTLKCGFPESRLNHYLALFKANNIDCFIIENQIATNKNVSNKLKSNETTPNINITSSNDFEKNYTNLPDSNESFNILENAVEIIYELADFDINNFTLKNAFDKLYNLHLQAKKIVKKN